MLLVFPLRTHVRDELILIRELAECRNTGLLRALAAGTQLD